MAYCKLLLRGEIQGSLGQRYDCSQTQSNIRPYGTCNNTYLKPLWESSTPAIVKESNTFHGGNGGIYVKNAHIIHCNIENKLYYPKVGSFSSQPTIGKWVDIKRVPSKHLMSITENY